MSEDLEKYYREGDNQFRIAGGVEGIMKLANDFYDVMETLPEAHGILSLHNKDLTESRDKLGRFLCGYLNGPDLYKEKYGQLKLAAAHSHVPIGTAERDTWLHCMKTALEKQPYPEEFRKFISTRKQVPPPEAFVAKPIEQEELLRAIGELLS